MNYSEKDYESEDFTLKYLRNQLSAEEKENFECWFMDKPDVIERLELDSIFFEHIPNVKIEKQKFRWNLLSWFNTPMRASVATFASCAIAFSVFIGVMNNNSSVVLGDAQIVYFDEVRSTDSGPAKIGRFERDSLATHLIIVLPVDVGAGSNFQVTVKETLSGDTINLQEVKVNETGEVSIVFQQSMLRSGEYQLVINPIFGEQSLRSFVFVID